MVKRNGVTRQATGGFDGSGLATGDENRGRDDVSRATPAVSGGAAVADLSARLPRRAKVRIEGTSRELSDRMREIVGPRTFDESAFQTTMKAAKAITPTVDGTLKKRLQAANRWAQLNVDPLAGQPLKLIGHGTDHAVYLDPNRPGKVVKISTWSMGQVALWNALFGREASQRTPPAIEAGGQRLAENEMKRYARLTAGFPDGAVPSQCVQTDYVPVRGAALQYMLQGGVVPDESRILPKIDPAATYRLLTIVREQDFLPQLSDPSSLNFSLSLRFIERLTDYPEPERYAALNDSLVLNRPADFDEAQFRYVIKGTKLEALYDASRLGDEACDSVRDFLVHGIRFMNDSREVLDVGGDGNVIFNNGKYFLPDALTSPSFEGGLDVAADVLRKMKRGEPVTGQQAWSLAFTLNIVRAMNGMAQALGIAERVHLLRPEEEAEAIAWAEHLPQLRGPESKPSATQPTERSLVSEPIVLSVVNGPWGFDTRKLKDVPRQDVKSCQPPSR